ncbi:MAG: hypothetical protein Q9165_002230 [Trypethelium subeluteriae]
MAAAPQDSTAARRLRARQASISRRQEGNGQDDTADKSGKSEPTDASSTAPTSSLVKAFEVGVQPKYQKAAQSSELDQRKRMIAGVKLPQTEPVPQSTSTTDPIKPAAAVKPSSFASHIESVKPVESIRQKPLATNVRTTHETLNPGHSEPSAYASASEETAKPMPPPPRRGRSKNPQPISAASTPASAPISIPPHRSSEIASLQNRRVSTTTSISPSPPSSLGPRPPYLQPNNYSQSSLKRISPHMSGSSIANAIIAANLSSRTPSPNPTRSVEPSPPLLPPRMEPRHHHHLPFPHRRNRTTSPPKKGFRTTMRGDPSDSDSDSDTNPHRRHRHRLMRKHPHKHHEGDRLRWRSSITAAERKRYEGVFASNKTLLRPSPLSSTSSSEAPPDAVHGLVVRDVWSRSRLPRESLREIWDLVAGQQQQQQRGGEVGLEATPVPARVRTEKGWLGREEFVVGMWLIDQRLKGRKLPIKVGESVWASVRGVGGLVVPKARRK